MPKKKDVGTTVRDWLTEKLGNPIMPSKEKDQIKQLEDEEKKQREKDWNDSSKEARVNPNWRRRG
jgi:hypothetical protein